MKIKQIILFSILFVSCGQHKIDRNKLVTLDSLQRQNLRITIINDSTQMLIVTEKYTSFWTPKWNQIDSIDTILIHSITEIKDRNLYYLKVDSIKNFYRQYVFYKDSIGDSIVFINAMRHLRYLPEIGTSINSKPKRQPWQKFIISTDDGGDSYWHIWINYSKKEKIKFLINGDA